LRNISLDILQGEIHAIIGEHGAGKSTFAKVISGFQPFKEGTIRFLSRTYDSFSFSAAQENRISIVHQYNPFFEDLVVGEYFYLDSEKKSSFFYSRKKVYAQLNDYFKELKVDITADTPLRNLRQSDRILIDVCKKMKDQPQLLILDEALEQISTDKLGIIVSFIKKLKENTCTTIIITHRVDDILQIADRISIFKDSRIIFTEEVAKVDKFQLIQMAYTNFNGNYTTSPDFFKFIKYNEAILQKLPVNLLVVDTHFEIKIVNEQIESFFGLPARALLNTSILEVFANIPKLKELIVSSILEKKSKAFFQIAIPINQRDSICKVNTLPILDGNLCIGSIVLLDDITDQVKLREQLQLKENLSSIELLAAGVAHEINTPLEIINYLVEEINIQSANPGLQSLTGSIREEVKNISRIIHNLIDFSGRPLSGQDDIFDIDSILTELLRLIRLGAERKNIRLNYSNQTKSSLFNGNKSELRQVFLNLLRNSFEAINHSGYVDIELRLDEGHEYFQIFFTDDGSGIDEEHIGRIFLPFFTTKKNTAENSGLGLALSYGIINNHGGRITVQNMNPGTRFLIELPYAASLQLG